RGEAMAIDKQHAKERLLGYKADTERAKQIILQILKETGGSLGKTKLFKSFWLAHLFYSKNFAGYLSGWKIVRMPYGPGIDNGDRLILELKKAGKLQLEHEPKGPYTETICKLSGEVNESCLPHGAAAAIKEACALVQGESASTISEWSHEFSRSWNMTPNGEELNIYTDLIPDDVYEERKATLEEANKDYDNLFI